MVQENSHLIRALHLALSSTPGSSPNTLVFNDLAGTQLTDEDTEKDQKEIEKLKDKSLVKYLIGDISESEL